MSVKEWESVDEDGSPFIFGKSAPETAENFQLKMIIEFDGDGNFVRWESWSYRPEDGIGWDWYLSRYDEYGEITDSEYKGQA